VNQTEICYCNPGYFGQYCEHNLYNKIENKCSNTVCQNGSFIKVFNYNLKNVFINLF
jgi:hypothetical protein